MKRRLIPMWAALWQELGVRPIDANDMTLDDALLIEVFADETRRRQARAAQQARRRGR